MTATLLDSFNRGNDASSLGNTDTGQTWSVTRGTWGTNGNAAYVPSNSGVLGAVAIVDGGDVVQDVFSVLKTAPGGSNSTGIVLRASDGDNFFFAMLNHNSGLGSDRIYAGKVVANVNSYTFANALAMPGGVETFPLTLRMIVDAYNFFSIYVNGTLLAGPTQDSSFNTTATKVGMHGYDSSERVENWQALVDPPQFSHWGRRLT